MDKIILSQANRIAQGDPDLMQNILTFNFQNFQNAYARGKVLSIGEQVNFMKYRAGEFKSGIRRDFGYGSYHAHDDVYNKNLYYNNEVEIFHIHHEDDADHDESPEQGKGEITAYTSIKDVEAECIFKMDFELFLAQLTDVDRSIILKRLTGFTIMEIADDVKLDTSYVRKKLKKIGKRYIGWFNITQAERFGLA